MSRKAFSLVPAVLFTNADKDTKKKTKFRKITMILLDFLCDKHIAVCISMRSAFYLFAEQAGGGSFLLLPRYSQQPVAVNFQPQHV